MKRRNRKSNSLSFAAQISSPQELADRAYQEAAGVLLRCIDPLGIKASAGDRGYRQIWTRDSMITLLGASLVGDRTILDGLSASIDLLRQNQTPLGCIPNNVDIRSGKPNFQAYADGGLWFVIGNAIFFEHTGDLAFLKKNYSAIRKTLQWYAYQDVDQSGLISIQEGTDWQDLFASRGKGLSVNVLHYFSLKKASALARHLEHREEADHYARKARDLRSRINDCFWFAPGKEMFNLFKWSFGVEDFKPEHLTILQRKYTLPRKSILKHRPYYLPYITFRDFGEWFDTFGNLLAILTGMAIPTRARLILDLIEKCRIDKPFPIKAIYPPVTPGGKDWRYYYRFENLNLPDQYHNGGIWPFLGGFYVAALIKMHEFARARNALFSLALLNQKGRKAPWEFNEWFHGKSAEPMGMAEQAWSAGMYIYAYKAAARNRPLFF